MSKLPQFPVNALPPVLRRWVEEEARATQTPADLAAWGAITVCSSRLARRVTVRPRAGWDEPTNIFATTLLGPGNRKSAVFADAIRPLREIEKLLISEAKPEVAKLKSRRRQAEAKLAKIEKRLAEKDDPELRQEADDLCEQLANEPEAFLPRLIADDVTPEKLAVLLREQGGRLMSAAPEGSPFDLMAGRYSKNGANDFDIYLKGHAGDDIAQDRISRETLRIERPALTCFYSVQPEVIRGLAGNSAMRGRELWARFLYAAPESHIGKREIGAQAVSQEAVDGYHEVVQEIGEFNGDQVLTLSTKASSLMFGWESEIEWKLADGGAMEDIRDWGAKLAGATLRIAAVLHACQKGAFGEIDAPTLNSAIEIARYCIPHAQYVLCELDSGDAGLTDQEKLVRWIEARGGEVSIRDLSHSGPRGYRGKIVDAEFALNDLRDEGLGDWHPLRPGVQGGRPTQVFRLISKVGSPGAGTETPEFAGNYAVMVPAPLVPHSENSEVA